MKIKYLLPVVAVAAMATSCSEDEFEGTTPKVEGNDVIEASMGGETRTELSTTDNETINWTSGDKITVYTATEASSNGGKITYTLTGGEGTNSGSFTGSYDVAENGKKLLAFYPADATGLTFATATTSTTPAYTISYTVPAEYTYDSQKPASLQGFPMVGVFDDYQKAVSFKNAAAVLDVTIQNVPAGYSYVEVEAQDVTVDNSTTTAPYLNGTGTITFVTSGDVTVPVLAIKDDGNTKSKKTKTSWTASTSVLESVRVIIPLPEATYPKLVLTLGSEDNTKAPLELKSWTDLGQVSRNERIASTITLDNIDASMKVVANAANATAALAAETPATSVCVLSLAETDGNTISLPANQDANSQSALTLQLSSVATGVTIDTTAASTTGKIVAAALEIKAAPATDDGSVPSLTLEVPTTTVTLNPIGENGKVTYGTVTVNTDLDSLIIGNGVTVNKLVIKSGNVIVKNGGTIASAELSSGVTSGAIYYHATSSPVTGDHTGITVAPVDLFNILQGGTVKLSQDISVAKMITVTKDLTLDLNGHNIEVTDLSARNCLYFSGSSSSSLLDVTIKGSSAGQIKGSRNGIWIKNANVSLNSGVTVTESKTTQSGKDATANAAILVDCGGHLTVDGATVTDDIYCGVSIYPDAGTTGSLTLTSGSITGKAFGITGNGSEEAAKTTTININGGTVTSTGKVTEEPTSAGIYHPQNGELKVTGGTITGVSSGIEMRAGVAEISGGEIKTTATTISSQANGSGPTIEGAVIAVSQHTYNATKNVATKVTVKSGATLTAATGTYAIYEKNLSGGAATQIGLDIQGGTINGKIYSENVTDFITGGTFSDLATSAPYATGKTASIKLSANQTVDSLSYILSGKRALTIDLQNHQITVTKSNKMSDILVPEPLSGDNSTTNYGYLKFKNGTVNYTGVQTGKFAVRLDKGALELDNMTWSTPNWSAAFNAQKEYVSFKATSSKISAKYYGVATNATTTYGSNSTMVFENTSFEADETGFMNNVPATISFKSCTFKGNHQGALLRAGTVTFSGANTIILNPTLPSTHGDCRNSTSTTWGTGNATSFAPLVIGNRDSGSYPYATSITFGTNTDDATTVKMATLGADTTSYATSFPGVYVAANSASGQGVTISGLSHLYKDSSVAPTDGKDIVYYIPDGGSSNITVDGTTVTSQTSTTLSTKSSSSN